MSAIRTEPTPTSWQRWWPFTRHLLEMVLAMVVGMIVLDPVCRFGLWLGGTDGALDDDTFAAMTMATNMSIGMAAWMRYRGRAWRPIVEMTTAMSLPFLVLFPALWSGAVSGGWFLVAANALMLPAMLAAMLCRRAEYSGPHHH